MSLRGYSRRMRSSTQSASPKTTRVPTAERSARQGAAGRALDNDPRRPGAVVFTSVPEMQVLGEPAGCQAGNVLQRSGLFEQVSRAGDDDQALDAGEFLERLFVHPDNRRVGSSHDQQGRRRDHWQVLPGEVGTSATRNNR